MGSVQVRQEPGMTCAGQWYCFDDTSVEPWDISNLERDCFGGKHIPETGYYGSKMQAGSRSPCIQASEVNKHAFTASAQPCPADEESEGD